MRREESADPGGHPGGRLRRQARHGEDLPDRRLDPGRRRRLHRRTRHPGQPAVLRRLHLDRLRAVHPAHRARARTPAPGAGPAPARPSAGCTRERRSTGRGRAPTRRTADTPQAAAPARLSHLDGSRTRSIHIIREVAASSSGRSCCSPAARTRSSCCTWRAKAFWPAAVPFSVMHVDTGHNFPEVIEYRDRHLAALGVRLVVASVQDSIDSGRLRERPGGSRATRCRRCRCSTRSTRTASTRCSAAAAATRRRRGPRSGSSAARRLRPVGSAQPASGAVGPLQRPAPAGRARAGLPALELDRARHLVLHRAREASRCPSIYYAHQRPVFSRDGMVLAVTRRLGRTRREASAVTTEWVRYRTVGDVTCTGAVRFPGGRRWPR